MRVTADRRFSLSETPRVTAARRVLLSQTSWFLSPIPSIASQHRPAIFYPFHPSHRHLVPSPIPSIPSHHLPVFSPIPSIPSHHRPVLSPIPSIPSHPRPVLSPVPSIACRSVGPAEPECGRPVPPPTLIAPWPHVRCSVTLSPCHRPAWADCRATAPCAPIAPSRCWGVR